ncbi:MAG TPA: hypothetical protein VEQ16_06880, partial [Acidocella sp.]|nr:hypothetical protein [Acidocella sp.]
MLHRHQTVLALAAAIAVACLGSIQANAQAQPAKPPAAKPAAPPAAAAAPAPQPTLLGQFGDWGAYTASPGGKKVCFALAKPANSKTTPPNRPRDPAYM